MIFFSSSPTTGTTFPRCTNSELCHSLLSSVISFTSCGSCWSIMGSVSRRFCGWLCLAGVGCRNVILFLTLLCLRITLCGIFLRSFSVVHFLRRWVLLFSGGRRGVRRASLASWLSSALFSGFHDWSGDQVVAGPCRDFLAVLTSPIAPSPTGSVLLTSDCIPSSFCTLESVLEGRLAGEFEGGPLHSPTSQSLQSFSCFHSWKLTPMLSSESQALFALLSPHPWAACCLAPPPAKPVMTLLKSCGCHGSPSGILKAMGGLIT